MSWHKDIFDEQKIENFYTWSIKDRLAACGVMRVKQINLLTYLSGLSNHVVEMNAILAPAKVYHIAPTKFCFVDEDL